MGRGSVKNLKTNTQYVFKVRGYDESGALYGGWSLPLIHLTTPGAPPDQVVGVQVKPILNGFTVLWASQGINVSHYEIWMTQGSGQGAEALELYATTDSNIATIAPLEPDPLTGLHFFYTVGIRAVSKEGVQGPLSDPLSTVQPLLRGGDGVPPPDPTAAPIVLSRAGINIVDMRAYNEQTLDWENMFLQFSTLSDNSWSNWEDLGQCGAIFLHTDLDSSVQQYRYQFKVIDGEGLSSAYSPPSEGTSPSLIDTFDITAGAILADLVKTLVLDAGLITTSDSSLDPRIDISREAFILWAKNSTTNQLYKALYFPTNNNPGTINMHIIAQTLQALGGVTLSGTDNKLDNNANLTLQSSVADPTTPPAVERYLPSFDVDANLPDGKRGLAYYNGDFYLTGASTVWKISSSTGVIGGFKTYVSRDIPALPSPIGITVVDGSIYVLREGDGGKFYITKMTTSFAEISNTQITSLLPNIQRAGGITYDGSQYVYMTYQTNINAKLIKLDKNSLNQVGTTINLPAFNTSDGDLLYDVTMEGGRISYQVKDVSQGIDIVRRCGTDGTRTSTDIAYEFESKGQGLTYATVDIARYWGLAKKEALMYKYTPWTTDGPTYYARYAWQGSLSTYESLPSSATSFAFPNRWAVRVDVPTFPSAEVSSVDIYMAKGSSDPYDTTSTQYELQANSTDPSVEIENYITTNSDAIKAPGASTGFSTTGSNAKIIASGTEIWGNGTLKTNIRSSAPSSPVNGEIYHDTTKDALGVRQNGQWMYATGIVNDPNTADGSFSTGDNTITTYTVPANLIQAGTTFRIIASGQYDAATTGGVDFKVVYGTTNLIAITVTPTVANNKDWLTESWVTFRGSGASVIATAALLMRHDLPGSGTTAYDVTKTSGLDTTSSKAIKFVINAAATNNIQIYTAFIEMIRA